MLLRSSCVALAFGFFTAFAAGCSGSGSGGAGASDAGGFGAGSGFGGAGAAGGGSAATGGQDAGLGGGPPDVCQRYLSCALSTQPATGAAVIAAYGEAGTCWNTTPEVAATCVAACQTGLEQLHQLDPAACPTCVADGECDATTPVCDAAKGQCVACANDSHCPGRACLQDKNVCVDCVTSAHCKTPGQLVCDPSGNTCKAGCTSDAMCAAPTPRCDLGSNQCVPCLGPGDCNGPEGKTCMPFAFQCGCITGLECASFSCVQGSCCIQKKCATGQCGQIDDGCGGKLNCGACPTGICGQTSCIGSVCTPGSADCPGKERCLFEPGSKTYRCSADTEGNTCLYKSDCWSSFGSPPQAYSCSGGGAIGKCQTYCVAPSDCASGKTCAVFSPPTSISNPGTCK